jgi:hypothetical protein
MDNPKSRDVKPWFLFGLTTMAMLVFAGLYFLYPKITVETKTVTVTNFVTNTLVDTVTNEVVREVPKEVEKIVTVPAKIPDSYALAMVVYWQITNASFVLPQEVLFKMKDVRVVCEIRGGLKALSLVSEDDVRAKFELSLRRNNVPVNPNSPNVVGIVIEGFQLMRNDGLPMGLLCYNINCTVSEQQFIARGGEWHTASVNVWDKGEYGTIGTDRANDGILATVQKYSESFANDYLSANPKTQ